jgi:hypothetical protein
MLRQVAMLQLPVLVLFHEHRVDLAYGFVIPSAASAPLPPPRAKKSSPPCCRMDSANARLSSAIVSSVKLLHVDTTLGGSFSVFVAGRYRIIGPWQDKGLLLDTPSGPVTVRRE